MNKDITSGYYAEATDRLHVITSNLQEFVADSMAGDANPAFKAKVEEAIKILGQAYQIAGEEVFRLADAEEAAFRAKVIEQHEAAISPGIRLC